jgi:hypothetical protein
MDKKQTDLLRAVKSDLEEVASKFSQLKILLNKLLEASKTCNSDNSQFAIKRFKRGDLN